MRFGRSTIDRETLLVEALVISLGTITKMVQTGHTKNSDCHRFAW